MERQVQHLLHQPFGVRSLLIASLWVHISKLGSSSVGVDALGLNEFVEEQSGWHENGEEPESSLLNFVARHEDSSLSQLIYCNLFEY